MEKPDGEGDLRIGPIDLSKHGRGGSGGQGMVPKVHPFNQIFVRACAEDGRGDDFGGDGVKFAYAHPQDRFLDRLRANTEPERGAIAHAQNVCGQPCIDPHDFRQFMGGEIIVAQKRHQPGNDLDCRRKEWNITQFFREIVHPSTSAVPDRSGEQSMHGGMPMSHCFLRSKIDKT